MILSASRRTDIPGYYSEWFLNRLKAGYALTRNPMNHAQISRIDLSPEKIDCIVFWTKDPSSIMDRLVEIDALGYHYYFQFTLTPYGLFPYEACLNSIRSNGVLLSEPIYKGASGIGMNIERNLRDKREILKTFQQLSKKLGKEKVLWRYDPIIVNDEITEQYHMDMFASLCRELEGYTEICTVSFVDVYNKLSRRTKDELIKEITPEEMHYIAGNFFEIGREHGIELRACAEVIDLSADGIKPAACIGKDIVEKVCGHAVKDKKDKNQRLECGCIQSVDIGVYNTCKNGCVYCYANHSEASILRNYKKHDPTSEILIGSIDKNEKVITRK
jgi:hypothetical protein